MHLTTEQKLAFSAVGVAGRAKYLARMKAAKAAGIIKRIPVGWRRTRKGGTYHQYLVDTARKHMAAEIAKAEAELAQVEVIAPADSVALELHRQTIKALRVTDRILDWELDESDAENTGRLRIQKEVASDIIKAKQRADSLAFRMQQAGDLPRLIEQLKAAELEAPED